MNVTREQDWFLIEDSTTEHSVQSQRLAGLVAINVATPKASATYFMDVDEAEAFAHAVLQQAKDAKACKTAAMEVN